MSDSYSLPQKLFKAILSSAQFEDMRKESMAWKMQCSNCRHETSIWSQGGVRWKAAGNPRVFRLCKNCDQRNWQLIYKKEDA